MSGGCNKRRAADRQPLEAAANMLHKPKSHALGIDMLSANVPLRKKRFCPNDNGTAQTFMHFVDSQQTSTTMAFEAGKELDDNKKITQTCQELEAITALVMQ